jgi:hypothetical protein
MIILDDIKTRVVSNFGRFVTKVEFELLTTPLCDFSLLGFDFCAIVTDESATIRAPSVTWNGQVFAFTEGDKIVNGEERIITFSISQVAGENIYPTLCDRMMNNSTSLSFAPTMDDCATTCKKRVYPNSDPRCYGFAYYPDNKCITWEEDEEYTFDLGGVENIISMQCVDYDVYLSEEIITPITSGLGAYTAFNSAIRLKFQILSPYLIYNNGARSMIYGDSFHLALLMVVLHINFQEVFLIQYSWKLFQCIVLKILLI